jgi:hypothetical protein
MVVMATSEKVYDRADGAERVDEIVKYGSEAEILDFLIMILNLS